MTHNNERTVVFLRTASIGPPHIRLCQFHVHESGREVISGPAATGDHDVLYSRASFTSFDD
jgi:hypothetical protein